MKHQLKPSHWNWRNSVCFAASLLVLSFPVCAQDSLLQAPTQQADSIIKLGNHHLDAIQNGFRHRSDSLEKSYTALTIEIQSSINKLKHKTDSLNKLRLPTKSVRSKIDSLQNAQTVKLKEFNDRIDKVKRETVAKLSSLHLPSNEINSLTSNIHGYSVPKNFFQQAGMSLKIPELSNAPSLSIPSNISIPSVHILSLQKLDFNQLPSLSELQGSLGSLKQLQSASNLQGLEKTVTGELAQTTEVKSLLKETSQATAMEKKLSALKSPKKMDSLATQQLKPAVNHFAGKEKELQSAMGEIYKYKQKYSNVKSLAELSRRVPNPLKGKPWIERVVPGLNYFIQSKHYITVDFNPYLSWKFSPKLTASIGWNERVGIVKGTLHTEKYDRVFGVRGSVSYLWARGFIFRLSPEAMEACVPSGSSVDTKQQALVWGLLGGIRKDFKLYKNLIGYSEGVYNFIQKPGLNIYGDRLSFRLGIEVRLKKKANK